MQKKSCRYLLPFEHNAQTRQTQTDRPRNGNINRYRRNRLSVMSPIGDKF